MLKRNFAIHLFICFVLGIATGTFLILAISNSSVISGIFAILATVASVLNILCGDDTKKKTNYDSKE